MKPRLRRALLSALLLPFLPLLLYACGPARAPRLSIGTPPAEPLDALVVPGCPSLADGALSPCQIRRATWAALLYQRGFARALVPSGAAVHSPFVEAEALAQALVALGVPAGVIYLEPDALHSDENILRAVDIARGRGWRRLGIASEGMQAGPLCDLAQSLGTACSAVPMEFGVVRARAQAAAAALAGLRAPRVTDFVPLPAREAALAVRTGRRRPPSALLYPWLGVLRLFRVPYRPRLAPPSPSQTYAERLAGYSPARSEAERR